VTRLADVLSSYALAPMRKEHLEEVCAIERSSQSNPWSREAFRHEVENNAFSRPLVALTCDTPLRVAGYCVFWIVFEQVQIQNIVVHPRHRRRGLAKYFLSRILDEGYSKGARTAELEVRASNTDAQSLYTSLGFRVAGEREGYYSNPRENALLLRRSLTKA